MNNYSEPSQPETRSASPARQQSQSRPAQSLRAGISVYALAMACWGCPVVMSGAANAQTATPAARPAQIAPMSPAALESITGAAPVNVPQTAQIAMARARQLQGMGADALVEPQLRIAAQAAPEWLEAQLEWARWLSKHEQWRDAASAWRQVVSLRNDAEARRELRRARNSAPPVIISSTDPAQSTQAQESAPSPRFIVLGQNDGETTESTLAESTPDVIAPAAEVEAQTVVSAQITPTLVVNDIETIEAEQAAALQTERLKRMPHVEVSVSLGSPEAASEYSDEVKTSVPVRVAQASSESTLDESTPSVIVQAVAQQRPATAVSINPKAAARVSAERQAAAWPLVERGANALQRSEYDRALDFYRQAYSADPHNVYAQNGVAESLLLLRRYSEAEAAYRAILEVRPNDAKVLRGLGDSLAFNDRVQAALPFYERSVALEPNNFSTVYQLAQAYTWTQQYAQAEPHFRRAVELQPYNAEVWAKYGEALSFTRSPGAASALQRALELNQNNTQALLALANLYSWNQNYDQAITTYRRLLQLEPSSVPGMIGLGNVLTYSGRPEEAIQPFRLAVNLEPTSQEAQLGLARALVFANRYDEGKTQLERVLQREPAHTEALQLLAMADAGVAPDTGDAGLESAIAGYEKVLQGQTDPQERAATLAAIGELQVRLGNLDEARVAYNEAMQLAPYDSSIGATYARSLVYEQQWEEAQRVVREVLRRDPGNAQGLVLETIIESQPDYGSPERAAALARRLIALDAGSNEDTMLLVHALRGAGQPEAAQRVLQHLAQRQREAGTPSLEIANAVRDAGDYIGAAQLYQDMLRANPNDTQARLNLAQMHFYQKDTEAAIRELDYILERDPQNIEARVQKAEVLLSYETEAGLVEAQQQAAAIQGGAPSAAGTITGRIQSIRAQYEQAVTSFEAAVAADPGNHEARINLARNLYYAKRTPEAIAQYQELIERNPTNTVAKLELAKVFLDQNRLSDAEALYNQVISGRTVAAQSTLGQSTSGGLSPLSSSDIRIRASALYNPALRRVAQLSPETLPPLNGNGVLNGDIIGAPAPGLAVADQIEALNGLGEIRRRQGRYQEAAQVFRRALALDSTDVTARVGLARALRGLRDFVPALAEVERVLAIDAGNLNAQVLRAQLLADTGEEAEAQQALDALVAGLPEEPAAETLTDMAWAFTEVRNYEAALALLAEAEALYPTEAYIPRQTADTLRAAGRWDEALEAYDRLLAIEPQDADAMLGKARVYSFADRLPLAEPLYRQVLELEPDNHTARTELAEVLSRRGNWPEAIEIYRAAIERNPEDFQSRVELARTLRYNLQFAESEAVLNEVLAADPNYAAAYVERGVLRGVQGAYEPGIADLRRALEIAPDDLSAQLALAEVLGYAGDHDESIQLYQVALERDPENQQARMQMAQVLSYDQRFDDALREMDIVLRENPDNVTAQLAQADIMARGGRVQDSIAIYNLVLASEPDNRRAQLGLAEAYVRLGDNERGLDLYRALIQAEPENIGYRVAAGRALGYARHYEQAAALLRNTVQLEPGNREARLALAEVLANAGDALPQPASRNESIAIYQQLVSEEPQNYEARLGLARVYSYAGRLGEAEQLFNVLLEEQPNNPDALLGLAETQRFNAQYFQAERTYGRVLAIDPANERAVEGTRLARRETGIAISPFVSLFSDSNNVSVRDYGLSVTVPTRIATVGVTATRGRYEDDGGSIDRSSLSLLLARRFGPLQARLILSRLQYGGAPDRTLYDLLLERSVNARQRYYFQFAKQDVFESLAGVQAGITFNYYRAGYVFPIGRRVDAELEGRFYDYSDGNNRYTLAPSIYYRLREAAPTLRVGLGYRREDSDFASPFYYTPQDYSAFALLADYVVDEGRLRYGLFGSKSLTSSTGVAGTNRPSDTLFGFLNYDLSETLEFFANGGIVRGPNYDSNAGTIGLTLRP